MSHAAFFNPIEIHEQIKGFFKIFAMTQSACPELFPIRKDMHLKTSVFLVIVKLFSWGRLLQLLAYFDLACINSNEFPVQNKAIFLL